MRFHWFIVILVVLAACERQVQTSPILEKTPLSKAQSAQIDVTEKIQIDADFPQVKAQMPKNLSQNRSVPITKDITPKIPPTDEVIASPRSPVTKAPPKTVFSSWAFLLQGAVLDKLLAHPRDLYVVDIDDAQFTKDDLKTIQDKGQRVVSYLSIGEAEDYRDYWRPEFTQGDPAWLEEENPDWKGNYKVRFWDPDWQGIILDKLDKIVDTGYDGVYLDIIDGYEYWQEKGEQNADERMVDFVKTVSRRAKAKNKDFLIIPQNSPELASKYLANIDGVGKEDTWYFEDEVKDKDIVDEQLSYLDSIKENGKFVLAIDYTKTYACDFQRVAAEHGFTPTIADRDLAAIIDFEC